MSEMWTVSFCAHCGALLPFGGGLRPSPKCDNCGESINYREDRIEGDFTEEEARRLFSVTLGEDLLGDEDA